MTKQIRSGTKTSGPTRKERGAVSPAKLNPAPARMIDDRIRELAAASGGGAWRAHTLASLRALVLKAAPGIIEEWKWDVPVWSNADGTGIICTGETYKNVVKLTFAKGASLPDPAKLFNSSLEGKTRRAIDVREEDAIDAKSLKALVRAAAEFNRTSAEQRAATTAPERTSGSRSKR